MSEFLELFMGLIFDVVGGLLELIFPGFLEAETWRNRILWGVVLLLLGGIIWWELR